MPLFFSPRVHFCRSICPGCCIPRLAEPSSPRACHHVRALLGHITEHLLQLLGEAEQQIWGGQKVLRWRKCSGYKGVQLWRCSTERGRSVCIWLSVYLGLSVALGQGVLGQMSPGDWQQQAQSRSPKLSSQVHCLKCLDNGSKVTLPTCFYCFTHKRKGGPSFMI